MNKVDEGQEKVRNNILNYITNENSPSMYLEQSRFRRTNQYSSGNNDDSRNASIDIDPIHIESEFTTVKKQITSNEKSNSKHHRKKSSKSKRNSLHHKAGSRYSNIRTLFHRKKESATPDVKYANTTFEENDKDDVDVTISNMKMVINTVDKRSDPKYSSKNEQASFNSPDTKSESIQTSSSQRHLAIKGKFNHSFSEYEQILIHDRRQRRAQTANRRKQITGSGLILLNETKYTPMYPATMSPLNKSLYLSRKNSYERMFDKPEIKSDIQIVGQNIKKYVENYENVSQIKDKKNALDVENRLSSKKNNYDPNNNKLNLVLEESRKVIHNQSNDTYSAIVCDSVRKSPDIHCSKNNLVSHNMRLRKNSSPFDKPSRIEEVKNAIEGDANKLLISNIKNMYINNSKTINSRDSDLKNKTNNSIEYSYGNDVSKMEPKINEYPLGKCTHSLSIGYSSNAKDAVYPNEQSPQYINPSLCQSSANNSMVKTQKDGVKHNNSLSIELEHNNKVLYSRGKEANIKEVGRYNVLCYV